MTFKITITFIFIFIFVFSSMSIGIYLSYDAYLKNVIKGDFRELLCAILICSNIIGFLLVILIGSKASKKLISPIEIMTKSMQNISINELDQRLNVCGSKDELKDLAKTFNEMLDRIQKSVETQNQFVSDASHELRTPIAVIQGYVNLLDRWGKDDKQVLNESIDAIKSESENMKILVEQLLFLARGDKNTQQINKESFMLNDLLNEIIKETKMIDTCHTIISEQNEEIQISADIKLIKEALRIFIDNSIKYTGEGGTIKINSYINNEKLFITIEDNGIGISEEDLPHIFGRFYRADKSRTKQSGGTGLGLSIAKWIIDNHNGNIAIWSKPNIGTIIRVELPTKILT